MFCCEKTVAEVRLFTVLRPTALYSKNVLGASERARNSRPKDWRSVSFCETMPPSFGRAGGTRLDPGPPGEAGLERILSWPVFTSPRSS
jgi:hypothetical protein